MAVVAASGVAGTLAYSNESISQVRRRVFDPGVLASDDTDPGDALNLLVVGIDTAEGLEGDVVSRRDDTHNTDSIILIRVDPASTTVDVVSFPRDLLVDIPGRTSRARINSAFETGGPELLVQTIFENFAIPVHHYIGIDFAGFRRLVEIVDGIPVYFPHPVRSAGGGDTGDPTVELEIPTAGCWVLGPVQALSFARVRKDYQVQDADGRWHTDMGGDYSRVKRQQLFIQLALRQAIAKGARNVNTLRHLIDLGRNSVIIDDTLEPEDMVQLSRRFRSFDPAEMVTHTIPTDEAAPGGPAYLYLREDEAEPVFDIFRGSDSSDIAPIDVADIVVQVRNGTGTEMQATDVTNALADVGFSTLVPGADGSPGFPTVIQYAAGSEAHARVLASWLAGDVIFQEDELPVGVDAILVTGTGWAGLNTLPTPYGEVAIPGDTTPADSLPESGDTTTVPDDQFGTTTTAPALDEGPATQDDPDHEDFYRATMPPPGVDCQRTN